MNKNFVPIPATRESQDLSFAATVRGAKDDMVDQSIEAD
jgi:hypothetical protein